MKEGWVKFALIVTALASMAMGGVFLIIPGWFIALSQAQSTNVAWLRNVGAGLVTVQGLSLLVATFRRRDTAPILLVAALTSTVQSGAGWYSIFTNEFSAEAQWAIVLPFVVATIASLFLWISWVSRRRTQAMLPSPADGSRVADGPEHIDDLQPEPESVERSGE